MENEKNEDRTGLAIELAAKNGHDFEKLNQVMKNAWLHNADTAIQQRAGIDEGGTPQPKKYICPICHDTGMIGERLCYECNPTGKREDLIVPVAETVTQPLETFSQPIETVTDPVFYGVDGNVIDSGTIAGTELDTQPPPEPDRDIPPEPKAGQYICSKCGSVHGLESKIGKKHLKFKV